MSIVKGLSSWVSKGAWLWVSRSLYVARREVYLSDALWVYAPFGYYGDAAHFVGGLHRCVHFVNLFYR
jgi:hypothetical protein